MFRIEQIIEQRLGLSTHTQENLLSSFIILAGLWVLSRVLLKIAAQRQPDSRKYYQWKKTTNYVVTGLGIILLANVWFGGIQSIATFLG